MPAPETAPSLTSIGPWRVTRVLGAGAMGEVYHGVDDGGREAAVKLLAAKFAEHHDFISRFHREITLMSGLDHPNIARALGSGDVAGRPYLAMEFVRGPTLEEVLKKTGALAEASALRVMIGVAKGLEHVHHKAGLVHRDIKPANILIQKTGGDPFATAGVDDGDIPKLIDFGLAKSVSSDYQSMTMTGAVMGTPHYMAPEQIRGEADIDIHADIYAVGATLFHLLTGRYPYPEPSPGLVMNAHLTKPAPDPGLHKSGLSQATRELVLHAMAKKQGDRYLSYRALILACEKALRNLSSANVVSDVTRSRRIGERPLPTSSRVVGHDARRPTSSHYPPSNLGSTPGTLPAARPQSNTGSALEAARRPYTDRIPKPPSRNQAPSTTPSPQRDSSAAFVDPALHESRPQTLGEHIRHNLHWILLGASIVIAITVVVITELKNR